MAEHRFTGFRIRERRRALGRTQASVAAEAGISASYLNLIEANRRAVGGRLLNRIAAVLGTDPGALDGEAERRLVDDLAEAVADPLLEGHALGGRAAHDLVAQQPAWGHAFLALYRAYLNQSQLAVALSDRLHRDPFLGDAVHQMLNHVTAVRSTSEILEDMADLGAADQQRFQRIIASESRVLSDIAGELAQFFDLADASTRTVTASDEVDDFIIARGNYFPALEAGAAELRRTLARHGDDMATALVDRLARRHGIDVVTGAPGRANETHFRNYSAYLPDEKTFVLLDTASPSTRRFQLARLVAELELGEAIDVEMAEAVLGTEDARVQLRRALAAYVAGALLFPYEEFHVAARQERYDIEVLRRRFAASFEQVCHRLVTLRKPGHEGIRFAFVRTDPAGHIAKRFPLPGLPLVRHGQCCPLWAIFTAFQTPDRVVRQVAAFPDNARFLFVARTVTKQPATFREPPFLHSVMLACAVAQAGQTVYAEGLDLGTEGPAVPVGPACRLCPRRECLQRAEAPILDENRARPTN